MAQPKSVLVDSLSSWIDDVGSYQSLTETYGDTSTALVGGTIDYPSSSIEKIGSGWATWSGDYTGEVVWDASANSVTIDVSGLSAFGFEVEPDQYKAEPITVKLSNGQKLTAQVQGQAGAQFFGYVGGDVTSITISDAVGHDFAFGDFRAVAQDGIDYRAPSAGADPIATNAQTVAATYGFAGEYLGGNDSYLTKAKATQLTKAGIAIVSLYENAAMAKASYFGLDALANGMAVGKAAYADAVKVGQSAFAQSAIYFGVDFDPGRKASALAGIESFFKGVAQGFATEAASLSGGNVLFSIGVYGSGEVDNLIKNTDHLASYGMLAGATSWTGSAAYNNWDVKQTISGATVQGVGVDTDIDKGTYFGQWGIAHA